MVVNSDLFMDCLKTVRDQHKQAILRMAQDRDAGDAEKAWAELEDLMIKILAESAEES